jgi:MFS family permease
MSFKGQKKVSISLDGPTIMSRPKPISNPSVLVWIAALAALTGAMGLGLVIGFSSPLLTQLETVPVGRVFIKYPVRVVPTQAPELLFNDPDLNYVATERPVPVKPKGYYRTIYFLSYDQIGLGNWVTSIITLGALFGALGANAGSSWMGKKNALCVYGAPFAGSWLLIAFAPNVYFLLVGRFLTGFFGGIISGTAPSYVCEIATPSIRGLLGSGFQVPNRFCFA